MSALHTGRHALVTGAAGFVGRWLTDALVSAGWTVTGTTPTPPNDTASRDVDWVVGDIRDAAHIAAALDRARPDAIFHLAGISYIPAAAGDPGLAADVNVTGVARLLDGVRPRRRAGTLDPAVVIIGSGEEYGRHEASAMPLRESSELRPHTVYAATKVAQEVIALEAWRSEGMRVMATRSFNHSGPGQPPHFLLPGLVARSAALRRTSVAPADRSLRMGNQSPVRDFLHVSDVAAAYIALAEHGAPGEVYNVASGHGIAVGELARRVLARMGLDLPVESDPALVRPADVPMLVGDSTKLRAATGWVPRKTLDDLLDDLISYHDAAPV